MLSVIISPSDCSCQNSSFSKSFPCSNLPSNFFLPTKWSPAWYHKPSISSNRPKLMYYVTPTDAPLLSLSSKHVLPILLSICLLTHSPTFTFIPQNTLTLSVKTPDKKAGKLDRKAVLSTSKREQLRWQSLGLRQEAASCAFPDRPTARRQAALLLGPAPFLSSFPQRPWRKNRRCSSFTHTPKVTTNS